jgi:hypothetical protein
VESGCVGSCFSDSSYDDLGTMLEHSWHEPAHAQHSCDRFMDEEAGHVNKRPAKSEVQANTANVRINRPT